MRPQFLPRTHRAREILAAIGRGYPHAWQQADHFRAQRGRGGLPDWPDWCYLPLHASYAIASGGGDNRVPLEHAHHVGIVGALAAWRMTQGIYRYDPALYTAVCDTPLERDLPVDPLYRLPEWCVYIETTAGNLSWPEADGSTRPIHGAWAHLDWDERDGAPHHELRLVLDCARDPAAPLNPWSGCVPVPIILGAGGLAAAVERVIDSGAREARKAGYTQGWEADAHADAHAGAQQYAGRIAPLVSLALYLCADDAEIGTGARRPANPEPKRTRRTGWRLFAAAGPTTWDVGVRIGAALRRAYQAEETGGEAIPTGRAVRPHIRRAHWHTFLAGPRVAEARERRVKWLPPIAVNVTDAGALPAVVRRVSDDPR
jgi:hypothetical protein